MAVVGRPANTIIAAEWNSRCCNGRVLAFLHWFASLLTEPIAIILEDGARVGNPLDPNFGPQWSTKRGEIFARACLCIKIAILIPICLTVSLVGSIIRGVTSLWRPQIAVYRGCSDDDGLKPSNFSSYTVLPPLYQHTHSPLPTTSIDDHVNGHDIKTHTASVTSIGGDPDIITICTYNVALLPHFVCMYNGVRPAKVRAPEVLRAILSRNPDVVCLQEAFHTQAVRFIVEGLKKHYSHIIWNVGTNPAKLSSGLLVASKLPLSNPQYWPHQRSTGTDSFSVKGVLGVTVHTRHGQIAVFNLHLNAPWGKDWQEVHVDQLKNVQDAIHQYTGLAPSTIPVMDSGLVDKKWLAVLQVGDYNIGPQNWRGGPSEDWHSMRGYFQQLNDNYLDVSDEGLGTFFDFSYGGVGWRPAECNHWPTIAKRMDHILSWRAAGHPLRLVTLPNDEYGPDQPASHGGRLRDGPSLRRDHMDGASDHLAVRAAFSLVLPRTALSPTAATVPTSSSTSKLLPSLVVSPTSSLSSSSSLSPSEASSSSSSSPSSPMALSIP